MNKVTELENALTELFRKGTEVGYSETEIDEFLEDIDYDTLLQAVWNNAETVYSYRADGEHEISMDYRGTELFKQRATLLYEDMGEGFAGVVVAARSMELWLLEDMGFAIVANFSVDAGGGEYITEHRQVLRLRYIDGMSWQDVAAACCYSQRYVYKLHGWALLAAAATMRGGVGLGEIKDLYDLAELRAEYADIMDRPQHTARDLEITQILSAAAQQLEIKLGLRSPPGDPIVRSPRT